MQVYQLPHATIKSTYMLVLLQNKKRTHSKFWIGFQYIPRVACKTKFKKSNRNIILEFCDRGFCLLSCSIKQFSFNYNQLLNKPIQGNFWIFSRKCISLNHFFKRSVTDVGGNESSKGVAWMAYHSGLYCLVHCSLSVCGCSFRGGSRWCILLAQKDILMSQSHSG